MVNKNKAPVAWSTIGVGSQNWQLLFCDRTAALSLGHCEAGNISSGSSKILNAEKLDPPSVLRLYATLCCR